MGILLTKIISEKELNSGYFHFKHKRIYIVEGLEDGRGKVWYD